MLEKDCSCAPREDSCLSVNSLERDALWWLLVGNLNAITDIHIELNNGNTATALRMRRRFQDELRLLDDLSWDKDSDRAEFALTMDVGQRRPLLDRLYWQCTADLTNEQDGRSEEANRHVTTIVTVCALLLGQMIYP